jgi:hypothetical protein
VKSQRPARKANASQSNAQQIVTVVVVSFVEIPSATKKTKPPAKVTKNAPQIPKSGNARKVHALTEVVATAATAKTPRFLSAIPKQTSAKRKNAAAIVIAQMPASPFATRTPANVHLTQEPRQEKRAMTRLPASGPSTATKTSVKKRVVYVAHQAVPVTSAPKIPFA